MWLLFEPSDERACPLKRQVEIIDTEEQQEPVAGCPAIRAHQQRAKLRYLRCHCLQALAISYVYLDI